MNGLPTLRTPWARRAAISRLALLAGLTGCGPHDGVGSTTVGQVWRQREQEARAPRATGASNPARGSRSVGGRLDGGTASAPPIATVDGHPIASERVVDLLLRSHGPGILEQLIVADAAARMAGEQGIEVTQGDVDREYERALRRMIDPLASVTPGKIDHEAGERVLAAVLSERNISREEFTITMVRNATLRRLIDSRRVFTEAQRRAEQERVRRARVRIRHIQLATPGAVQRVQAQLASGVPFADLAVAHSANLASAPAGGLLEPFTEIDEEVPAPIRRAAFALTPGATSGTVQVGRWYHILRLEQRLPGREFEGADTRDEIEHRLRARLTEPAMRNLYERLFREASVVIHDPGLREAFQRRHPNRGR